jgi:hypothetical protein
MVIVPTTISHAPRKIPSAVSPGPGHAMITAPAAIESSPVITLVRRAAPSIPEIRAVDAPSRMNSTPMNVARLRTDQSMLKISTPATISSRPLRSSTHQLLAIDFATSRVILRVESGVVPGATNILNLRFL